MKTTDVVIVGGGAVGSAVAYHLASSDAFDGTVMVVERDPAYRECATALSWGGIRQQFSTRECIEMSAYGMQFYREAPARLEVDGDVPDLAYREAGYLLLYDEAGCEAARPSYELQRSMDVPVEWLSPDGIAGRFPEVDVEGLAGATFGYRNEGYIDPMSLLNALKRKSRQLGVEYVSDEVVGLRMQAGTVTGVRLKSGADVETSFVVNAAGPRGARVAAMADVEIPVTPQSLVTYVFDCERPVDHRTLTEDSTGVILRPEGSSFLTGISTGLDADPWRFGVDIDYTVFDERIWPKLAHRIPAFEAIKVRSAWVGHFDYNRFDQNAFIGAHPEVAGLLFACGFSGHGLQHSPATGRALTELIAFGEYRTLDVSRFGIDRLLENRPIEEAYVIGIR